MLRFIFRAIPKFHLFMLFGYLSFLFSENLPMDSFIYEREPFLETKSFTFPSFELSPPEMIVNKITQHLTPLSSFLEEQKVYLTYIVNHSQLTFIIPFSSAFYYILPLPTVKRLEINIDEINRQFFSLNFEESLNHPLQKLNCTLRNLTLLPQVLLLTPNHKLSSIKFSCNQILDEYSSKKNKNHFNPFINNFFPSPLLGTFNIPISTPNQEKFYLRFETIHKSEVLNKSSTTLAIDICKPKIGCRVLINRGEIPVPFIEIEKLYIAKLHCPLKSSLLYLNLYSESVSPCKFLVIPSNNKSSPTKETLLTQISTPQKPHPNVSYLKVKSEAYSIRSKYTPSKFNFFIPSSQLLFPKVYFPRISSLILGKLDSRLEQVVIENQKYSYQPKLIEFAKLQLNPTENSIRLTNNSFKTTTNSRLFLLSKVCIPFHCDTLFIQKGALSYFTHLNIPNNIVPLQKIKSSKVFLAKNPTAHKQNIIMSKTAPHINSPIELPNTEVYLHPINIEKDRVSLQNQSSIETSKTTTLTSLNIWNHSHLRALKVTEPKFAIAPVYISAKEVSKQKIKSFEKSLSIDLSSTISLENHHFILSNYTPKLIDVSLVASPGKNFLTYNLNDSPLHKLAARYLSETTSSHKSIFTYHEAISSLFQEPTGLKGINPFKSTICNFQFPDKISHQVILSKNPPSLDVLINKALIQIEPKYAPKEGLFPDKQFFQVNNLGILERIELYNFISQSFIKGGALPIEASIALSSTELKTGLIQIHNLSTLYMPKVYFDELQVPLETIATVSNLPIFTKNASTVNKLNRFTLLHLAQLPTLELLQTYSLSDDFKVDAHILQKSNKSGYSISLQISPFDHECLNPIPSKVYFILDRSSSIESIRFNAFKHGLIQSLSHLHESSTFNILTFDQSFEKLSPEDLKPTKANIQQMKKSLEKVSQKWSSSFPTLLTAIKTLQKQAETTNKPHTVIILTDGHFLKNLRYNREAFNKLFQNETSNFSLFTSAISDNNNTFMLELMSKLGRGEFLHSQTHAAFPRKLSLLLKKIQRPLITDIKITLVNPNKKILFAHSPITAPLLYSDRIYNIYGEIEKLELVELIIQGKSDEKWINIVKKIDLTKAEKARAIDKELASKQALYHIMNFILQNDQNELLLAKEIVTTFSIHWNL